MPPKDLNPLRTSSSSSDDKVETSSSEEEEQVSKNLIEKKPETASPSVAATQTRKEESGSESDSGTDSDTETEIERTEEKSVKASNGDVEISKSSAKSGSKRPNEVDETSESVKRAKTGEEESEKKIGSEMKKPNFTRVWKEEDEIALLEGYFGFEKEFGIAPKDDMNKFYIFVKKSLSFDASKNQFTKKIRSLKKKYENNREKKKNVEEQQVFPKSKAFKLSEGIWGAADGSNVKSKTSMQKKKVQFVEQEDKRMVSNESEVSPDLVDSLVKSLVSFGVDDVAARQGFNMMAAENKKKLKEQWKVLQLNEFEFYSEKTRFVHEVMTKITQVFKSNS